MNDKTIRRAFVIGAYVPNGGTYMAYHIGRILDSVFGYEVVAVRVGSEAPSNAIPLHVSDS